MAEVCNAQGICVTSRKIFMRPSSSRCWAQHTSVIRRCSKHSSPCSETFEIQGQEPLSIGEAAVRFKAAQKVPNSFPADCHVCTVLILKMNLKSGMQNPIIVPVYSQGFSKMPAEDLI